MKLLIDDKVIWEYLWSKKDEMNDEINYYINDEMNDECLLYIKYWLIISNINLKFTLLYYNLYHFYKFKILHSLIN
jgi:hypothetical protein